MTTSTRFLSVGTTVSWCLSFLKATKYAKAALVSSPATNNVPIPVVCLTYLFDLWGKIPGNKRFEYQSTVGAGYVLTKPT